MAKPKFPVLVVILLIFSIVWFFNEIGYFRLNLPWVPLILAIIAVGMIFNRFRD